MKVAKQKSAPCKGLLCSLLGYSRQAFHKTQILEEKEAFREDLILQEVERIRKCMPKIGGRKLFFMLSGLLERSEIKLGRDGFFDLLRVNGLLVRRRIRKTRTTYSDHVWQKYPNLIVNYVPQTTNRLWASDITYIMIGDTFGYLSLITDLFSHKILGFYLSPDLKATGCIKALEMAIKTLDMVDMLCLIHHSDRGIQYCCAAYVNILTQRGISISMTENGDPRENSVAERVNGILKTELLKQAYSTFKEAQTEIANAIRIYNTIRPHASIGLLTPNQLHGKPHLDAPKKWKSYYSYAKTKKVGSHG